MDLKPGNHYNRVAKWCLDNTRFSHSSFCAKLFAFAFLTGSLACCSPREKVVLKQIRDVVVDANVDPRLKAQAVFFNPNKDHGKLKRIKVDIFVNEKKVGMVDQKMKIK